MRLVSTTEDPIDDLRYHKVLNEEKMFTRVITAFRPDKAMFCANADFAAYLAKFCCCGAAHRQLCRDAHRIGKAFAVFPADHRHHRQ